MLAPPSHSRVVATRTDRGFRFPAQFIFVADSNNTNVVVIGCCNALRASNADFLDCNQAAQIAFWRRLFLF